MDVLNHLALGFGVAFAPINLIYALAGCVLGTLVGVLPGAGAVATMAMLLPATTALAPVSALLLLAGIYCGAPYGRAIAAMGARPAEGYPAAAAGISGYPLARLGGAGQALTAVALGCFFAGCVGTLVLAALAPALSRLALPFGPVEYVSLLVLGLMGGVVTAPGSLLKAIGMVVLGMLLGLVGRDANTGVVRFAWGVPELSDGLGFVALAMGVFGYGEIISKLGQAPQQREVFAAKLQGLWPRAQDLEDMAPAVLGGTVWGSLLGALPGGGALLASRAPDAVDKKSLTNPDGVPSGKAYARALATPGSAHSAGVQTAFLPLLALGIPSNAVMAMLLGVMLLHKVQPGPQLIDGDPGLFWGLIASLFAGNLMLVVLNLTLRGVWLKLLRVPYRWLYPAIVLLCAIGIYSTRHSSLDVWLVAAFGLGGYGFNKLGMEPAPLLLGFVLGPRVEDKLRAALQLSHGEWSVFVMRPLSAGLLLASVVLVFLVLTPAFNARRAQAFAEE